jgi:hypothetical protein
MNQKKLKMILAIVSGIALLAAIVVLVLSFTVIQNIVTRIIMIITAVLFLALAGEVFYLFWMAGDSRANYFLYDSRQGRNIPVQKLAFQTVNVRMNRFLSGYAPSEGKLWTDKILDNPYLEMADAFKPLVAYKLLFDLAEHDSESGWNCFELASYETVEFLCHALETSGDDEMAQNLRQMKAATPINLKYVRDYLVRNRQYLKEKMRRYVCDNIQQF